MRYAFLIVRLVTLATLGIGAAQAAPATTPAAKPVAKAAFGCAARAPATCHFRIFYARESRNVVLPAGMKVKIPGVVGRDTYCVEVNKRPRHKCTRKNINAQYNS